MIKLKVTDEMIAEIKMGVEAGAWHQARAILDIVERDLNNAMIMLGQFGGESASSGCAEIEVL